MSTWAVLAAAGSGARLGEDRPKAFARLGDLPLLAESLRRLDESDWVDGIVVVAPPGWEEPSILLAEELGAGKVAASVAGGATRTASVRAGVREVPQDALVVLVHDAARPIIPDGLIERLLAPLAEGWDAVVPVVPISDTVKRVAEGVVVETVEREALVVAQTPQGFLAEPLRAALADGGDATDCAALVERRGGRVRAIEGDPRLLKVTTPADLELVATWL